MNVPGDPPVSYSYDNANRLTQITQGTSTVMLVYDAADRLSSLSFPNAVVANYVYDGASHLTGVTYSRSGVTIGDLIYDYDAEGRRVRMGGSLARTSLPQVLNSTTYDSVNQQIGFGTQTHTFDTNGNLTSDGINTYTWNARNQLIGMSGPGLNASFGYDALGRRVSKTVNSASTSYLYDGGNIIQEQSGGSPSANTLTGGVDQFFSRSDASGTVSPLRDSLGSSIALADSTGAVQTQYSYEPFGKTTATGAASNNSQKYTGREDDGTGLYYYRARYYSPALHRFIREDPIGLAGGINLYSYVENDPVSFRDPWGLDKRGGSSWSDKWFELADIRSAQEWWRKFHDEQIKEGNWALASLADLEDGLLDYSGLNTVHESSEVLGSDASTGAKLWSGTKIAGVAVSWYLAGTTQITGRIAGQTRTSRIIGLRNKFGEHWYTDENGFFFALDSKFHRLHIGQWKGWFK